MRNAVSIFFFVAFCLVVFWLVFCLGFAIPGLRWSAVLASVAAANKV
jgi:hypothetical protein